MGNSKSWRSLLTQKKSISLIILLLFWVGYSGANIYGYFYMLQKVFQEENQARLSRIDFHTENSISYLVNDKTEPLMLVLEKARQMNQFDFFLLKKNDQLINFGNHKRNLASIDQNYQDYAVLLDDGKALFKTIKIMDYTLTVGSHKMITPRFFEKLDSRKWILLADIVGVGLLVLLISLFSLRDIRKLSFALETGTRGDLKSISTVSREGQALLSSAVGMQETQQNVISSHNKISKIVGPAIMEELRENKPAPYSFQVTLVRVDLNGYTQLFLQRNVEYISNVLNIYFQKAHDVIQRYHGRIYQYVGDEIVFFIKDQEGYDSQLMAMSAIRNLFTEAENIERTLTKSEGHNFKLKASFCHGSLRFVQLDEGYAFSGLPLIESVRMLGAVKEKNENTLIFFSHELSHVTAFCEPQEEISLTFKGFAQESKLIQVQKMHTLSSTFHDPSVIEKSFYFRGDHDLTRLFSFLSGLLEKGQSTQVLAHLQNIRDFRLRQTTSEVVLQLNTLMARGFEKLLKHPDDELKKVVATMIGLVPNLIPLESYNATVKGLLLRALDLNDSRIRANALEVLGIYEPDLEQVKNYFQTSSNRMIANALLIEGKKKMKRIVRHKLEEMLASKDEHLIASSIWVIGELAEHYHRKDLATFLSNPDLQALLKKTTAFVAHESTLVQSRAKLTNDKINGLQGAA